MLLQTFFIFICILAQQLGADLQPLKEQFTAMNFTDRKFISDVLTSLRDTCNITYSPEILKICERSIRDIEKDSSYFDYEEAICMSLYYSVQRICSSKTNMETVYLKKSDEKLKNVSALCNEMKSALNVSSIRPSKDKLGWKWVILLNEKFKLDDSNCIRTCIEDKVVNPVCTAVLQANNYLKKSENSIAQLEKVEVPMTPTKTPEKQHGNADVPRNLSQELENPETPLSSPQEEVGTGNTKSSSGVPLHENSPGISVESMVPPTDDIYSNLPQVSNFDTDDMDVEALKQESGKETQTPVSDYLPSPPESFTKYEVQKTLNSGKQVKPKTQEIEKAHAAETHEENSQSQIPERKFNPGDPKDKEKPKSSEHLPSEAKQTQPIQSIKNEMDTKDSDPKVIPVLKGPQQSPPETNAKSSLPTSENAKPEKIENTDDSSKKAVDVKEPNTVAAAPPPAQNSESTLIMATSDNANASPDEEDIGLMSNDPELGGDLDAGSMDMKYTQNEKKGEISNDDDDVGMSLPSDGFGPGQKFVNAEDSHFFAYFMSMVILCIIGYLVFHNKQKILALALEGRSRRSTRRRPNTSGYRKLDSNLEEAVTSACSTSVTHVIY